MDPPELRARVDRLAGESDRLPRRLLALGALTARLAPDGTYIPETGSVVLCPDGKYYPGKSCRLLPDGRYVGTR